MNMRGRSRAWVVALAVAATGMGILPAASSAAPRRAQCATINKNIEDELGWEEYYTALGSAYLQAGDTASANSAFETAATYSSLFDGGMQLWAKLGC
jgi:Tfp pilus assembly protein PilF